MKLRRIIIPLVCLIAAGCQGKVDPEFISTDDIILREGDQVLYTYDPLTWQTAFNRAACEFRVHTDNMSNYWCVKLDCVPTTEGQKAKGSIEWTTKSSVNSRSGLTFVVEKADHTGHLWLWCRKEHIGAVVQILD